MDGTPGWFGGFVVLAIVLAITGLLVRVSLARRFAREAGIDEDEATTAAIFGTGAVTSTYLAASAARERTSSSTGADPGHIVADLSGAKTPSASQAEPPRTSADRLRELEQLRDQNLITAAEYDARRQAILESI